MPSLLAGLPPPGPSCRACELLHTLIWIAAKAIVRNARNGKVSIAIAVGCPGVDVKKAPAMRRGL